MKIRAPREEKARAAIDTTSGDPQCSGDGSRTPDARNDDLCAQRGFKSDRVMFTATVGSVCCLRFARDSLITVLQWPQVRLLPGLPGLGVDQVMTPGPASAKGSRCFASGAPEYGPIPLSTSGTGPTRRPRALTRPGRAVTPPPYGGLQRPAPQPAACVVAGCSDGPMRTVTVPLLNLKLHPASPQEFPASLRLKFQLLADPTFNQTQRTLLGPKSCFGNSGAQGTEVGIGPRACQCPEE